MATADQMKALVKSHADGDDARFYAIAMQVAAQAARSGHTRFAEELRTLVDTVRARKGVLPEVSRGHTVPFVQPRGELAGLLAAGYSQADLSEMVLADEVAEKLRAVVIEQRSRERIKEHGLSPMRKLVLIGPPGTGKTMTAGALAGELGIPLFSIQLDGLITKYMGETAAKLRLIFDAMAQTRGVYLFDEFDALGSDRGAKNDVGEIRRILNSFLQFLENDASDSLIVCATNHGEMLDRALFRRFDAVIRYGLADEFAAEKVMRFNLAFLDTRTVDWAAVRKCAAGLCHAEIARACEAAAKKAILGRRTVVTTDELTTSVEERKNSVGK